MRLIERETWKLVPREKVPRDSKVLGARFVLALKDLEKEEPVFKARFVLQGHKDREKSALLHASTNMRQPSIKVMTAISAIYGFALLSTDVSQAYFQSMIELRRDVCISPKGEFALPLVRC